MNFLKLKFNHYKIYYGSQEIDLNIPPQKPPYRKNLILVGGLNGSGKTTILRAIRLALFARRGMSKREHEELMSGAINERAFAEGERNCSVQLSFQNNDELITIEVILNYDDQKKFVSETRNVYIQDQQTGTEKKLTAITGEQFNHFINDRIPLDSAEFFIFDGEDIQDLVDKQGKGELKEAIQQIFSLNTISKLKEDLKKVLKDYDEQYAKTATDEEHKTLLNEINQIKDEIDTLHNSNRKINDELIALDSRRKFTEQNRRKKLAQNSNSRAMIEKRLNDYNNTLEKVNKDIQTFAEKQIHSLLLSPLIKKLQDRLLLERKYLEKKIKVDTRFQTYEKFMDQLITELRKSLNPVLKIIQIDQLKTAGKRAWATIHDVKEEEELANFQFLHDLSQGDYKKLLQYPVTGLNNIKQLIDQKIQLENKIKQLANELDDAPEAVDTAREDEELAEINQRIGQLKQQLKINNHSLMNKQEELNSKQKRLGHMEENLKNKTPLQIRREYTDQLIQATHEFLEQFTRLKSAKIRNEFHTILERLIRKDQEFFDVEFDEEKYTFQIFDDRGNKIKLHDRSAGEKQIIALSFIWALTKTAGLPLPFVIDTPLGRLDSIHRTHLVQYFFSQLSDQVIILSTDTEINQEYLDTMKNYLAKEYRLDYNPDEKCTHIKEGYFIF